MLADGTPHNGIDATLNVCTQCILNFLYGSGNRLSVALVCIPQKFPEALCNLRVECLIVSSFLFFPQVGPDFLRFATPEKTSASRSTHVHLASGTVAWSCLRASPNW